MLHKKNSSSGNALFLILIAVGLFAALSYAVVQSTRSGGSGSGASKEKNRIMATEIMQYSTSVANAVLRLQVANECTPEMINFENPTNNVRSFQLYENANAPTDKTCNVFDKAGGGIPVQAMPKEALTPCCTGDVQPGEYGYQRYSGRGLTLIDNQAIADLWMFVPSLKKEVCIEINNQLGIENPSGLPPTVAGTCFSTRWQFTGAYGGDGVTWCGLEEKTSACVLDDNAGGVYYYYHLLSKR